MNTKSHMRHNKPSPFVAENKEKLDTSAEVTMSDIAKKLRSVHTKMQMKHMPYHLTAQSSVEERFKSYLDDISRAILAEYYMRRQKEKKLFESLEQIKILLQTLQSEKKNTQGVVTRQISRAKLPHSVVQHLAQMVSEENQQPACLQEKSNFSEQKSIASSQINSVNVSQYSCKNSLPKDVVEPSVKEDQKIEECSIREERYSDVQASARCLEDHLFVSSLKEKLGKIFSFLRYSVKKLLSCFLTIAFMAAITLCFYSVLRGARFFNSII